MSFCVVCTVVAAAGIVRWLPQLDADAVRLEAHPSALIVFNRHTASVIYKRAHEANGCNRGGPQHRSLHPR